MEIELSYEDEERLVNKVIEKLLSETGVRKAIDQYCNDESRNRIILWMDNLLRCDYGRRIIYSEMKIVFEREFERIDRLDSKLSKLIQYNEHTKDNKLYKAYLHLTYKVSELDKEIRLSRKGQWK
jgi:hypothetical protein